MFAALEASGLLREIGGEGGGDGGDGGGGGGGEDGGNGGDIKNAEKN